MIPIPAAVSSSWRTRGTTLVLTFVLTAMLALTLGGGIAHAATFTVTNTNDSGDGSLREAITDANATPNAGGPDNIDFDIPAATDPGCDTGSGVCTILPQSALPDVTEAVIIDGYTQSGASANTLAIGNDAQLKIELSGAAAGEGNGLRIRASNCVVRGLVINDWFNEGVEINGVGGPGVSGNRIEGNFIGTDATGEEALGNVNGVRLVDNASDNVVGGTSPAARNVISGNFRGVLVTISSSGNEIQGNYVGTDVSGTQALGNNENGVVIRDTPDNAVGGTSAAARNVISGNGQEGVEIAGDSSSHNEIIGNYIGTDVSGEQDLGNSDNGVEIEGGAPNNVIGGTSARARNIISANDGDGVSLFFGSANRVEGNYIGTGVSGTQDLGNSENGVTIRFATDSVVGGTSASSANIISNNGQNGVLVLDPDAVGNSILRNSIFDNDELGIDLVGEIPRGVTANDPQDPDLGPNLLQNYPVITSATTPNGRSINVQGTLNSNPNEAFTIQLFSSPTADPSGYGEGKTFLGQTNVAANAGGNASFSFSANVPVAAGEFVTATATNTQTGDTSEFSRAVGVQDNTRPTVVSTNPRNGATGVPARADVFATFSESMNPSTINPNTFKLFKEVGNTQTQVPASVSYNEGAMRARLDPNANLTPGTRYVGLVTERARDLAGNQLAQRKTFYFVVAR